MCTPARQALLTGKYPHAVGVTLLQTPLPEAERIVAEHLKGQGCVTGAIGKMHFVGERYRQGSGVEPDLGWVLERTPGSSTRPTTRPRCGRSPHARRPRPCGCRSRLQRQMLDVFYRTDPRAGRAPASAPVEAQLDFFLTPPER